MTRLGLWSLRGRLVVVGNFYLLHFATETSTLLVVFLVTASLLHFHFHGAGI